MKIEPGRYATAWTKFCLLMWKNFLQQWRHPIQTVVELILPVATMTFVLLLRWQVQPLPVGMITYPPIPANTLNYSTLILANMNHTQMAIAYSPHSPILESVVRSSMANLIMDNKDDLIPIIIDIINATDSYPDIPPDLDIGAILDQVNSTIVAEIISSLINVRAYENSKDLKGLYALEETTTMVIAAVEFDDELHGAEQLPLNLSYALRFPERPRLNSFYSRGGRNWRTDSIFPVFEIPGPRFPWSWEGGNDPGYVNEMFIALQHVISTELISRVTGQDLTSFRVNIQRYPHPPYVQDYGVNVLQMLFPMFIMLSFSYTAINIVRAVTVEKELQLKETMKIMGLPTWLHWTAWFSKQFIFQLVTAVLLVILLKVNWFTNEAELDDSAVFIQTPWTVLIFFIVIYLSCMIFFSFMLSGFFSKGNTASLFTGVIWFLSYIPSMLLAMDVQMSTTVQIISCLSINTAMSYGFQLMLAKESSGGLQWGEFMLAPSTETSRFVYGHVIIMLLVDCVLYMLVALYLEQVLPGPFGAPKPWYFPFQLSFWCPRKSGTGIILMDDNSSDDVIKDKDPDGLVVGVRMHNLTKVFENNIAVNHLTMNIYNDQITVLLGHNGAGKSTTISMLTGNLEITHGSIYMAGYDMATQAELARAHIGLCPQHNVLFNELTVREHLEFFARLKGFTGAELKEEIDTLIEKLELEEKRNHQSNGLSGGQKRRLCVGIALSGAAKVVLLDEPTSGMDPASRRGLWELLQKEKTGRSMILTTHFMDEADILGDRVAIMAHGKLQCVGSPYFLKRHYGVGYTLVVVKDEGFDYNRCTSLINEYIPGSVIKEDRGTEVTYSLLNEFSHVFEKMLNDLERNAPVIKFINYGLIATTLEDVFMSVGSDLSPLHPNTDSDDAATINTDSTTDEIFRQEMDSSLEQLDKEEMGVTGLALVMHHVWAVWLKLGLVWMRSWWLILLQFVTPVVIINATLGVLQYVMSLTPTIRNRLLALTEGYSRTETLLSFNGTSTSTLGALAATAYQMMFGDSGIENMDLTFVGTQPIDEYYLNRTFDPIDMGTLRHQLLIGATFAEDSATAWFSNFGYHDVGISLSAVHSAILKAGNPDAELTVYNHPLEANYNDQTDLQVMISMLAMQLSSGIGSSIGIVSAVFIMFYIKERVSGAKLLQKAAGVQPIVLWGSSAVFDWLWFLIACISITISCLAFNVVGLSTAPEIARLYLCFMVYGAAMLPIVYILSHVFKGPALGFVGFYFINVFFGNIGAQIVEALWSPELDTKEVADTIDYFLQFFPLYSLVTSVRFLNQIGLRVHMCLQMCENMPNFAGMNVECTMEAMCSVEPTCCAEENPYFNWKEPGILRYLTCTVASGVVFWLLLMIIEYRLIQKVFTFKKRPPPIDESTLDADVAHEAARARSAARGEQALCTNDLAKYYGKNLAVDQVSFCVSDGECFGLLGVNGAGKTSTFKMLMGDESISSGEAYVSRYSVQKNLYKVHKNIGYCPQFDALFPELSGRETLRVFSLMRGRRTPSPDVLAQALGFEKHLDKRVNQYSGGTKRKLNTAVSLLGRTRMIFVDEPTTGVDPAAKRHVWRAVRGAQQAGRGVVLTSHSMEEAEALCSRLTIMVNGRFQCIGTPQHLKNKFSRGFTLTIKLKSREEDNVLTRRSLTRQRSVTRQLSLTRQASVLSMTTVAVKDYVKANFNDPKIMEEYQGMLTYYLPDRNIAWSRMFGIMERAKRDLEVEDYTISQATLEQIFLQFTKYQGLQHQQIMEELSPQPTIEVIN